MKKKFVVPMTCLVLACVVLIRPFVSIYAEEKEETVGEVSGNDLQMDLPMQGDRQQELNVDATVWDGQTQDSKENGASGTEEKNTDETEKSVEREGKDALEGACAQEAESAGENEVSANSVGDIINVALPTEFDFVIDPYGIQHDSADRQIFSDTYEVVNYGTQDVIVTMTPSMTADGYELVDNPPEKGCSLSAANMEIHKAVYLAMRVADETDETQPADTYTFEKDEYDQVMSTNEPAEFHFYLKGCDPNGEVAKDGRSAFQFVGNVDPLGEYANGEIKVKVVFSIREAGDETSLAGKCAEGKENMLTAY